MRRMSRAAAAGFLIAFAIGVAFSQPMPGPTGALSYNDAATIDAMCGCVLGCGLGLVLGVSGICERCPEGTMGVNSTTPCPNCTACAPCAAGRYSATGGQVNADTTRE